MSIVILKTIQVILALSILILVHELGHFFFAKLFKIKVDKFFLFFDAYGFKLLSTKTGWFSKLFPKLKNSETEYGIGWLPLGGYCKINGMIDESLDTEGLKSEPKPWEFRSKPAWQRFWVMVGGVLFNFIFAVLVYIVMLNIWGQAYQSNKDSKIYVNDLAYNLGFRNGDEILQMDGYTPEDFAKLQLYLARKEVKTVKVLRGGDTISIYIDQSKLPQILSTPAMFTPAVPCIIDSLPEYSPNNKTLQKGDRIISVDGNKIEFIQDLQTIDKQKYGKDLVAQIVRKGDTLATTILIDSLGKANFYAKPLNMSLKTYNTLQAIPEGFKMTYNTISGYLNDLKLVVQPSTGAYKSVGSFISIGKVFPNNWNLHAFLYILGLLSIMLGVMNLLPIPALDGGHIVFVIYEMLSGKKPSDNFLMRAQIAGMVLLFALMFFACGNDVIKLIK